MGRLATLLDSVRAPLQLACGILPLTLPSVIAPLRFHTACLMPVFFILTKVLFIRDATVGSHWRLGALQIGSMTIGCVWGASLISIVKVITPVGSHTELAVLSVVSALGAIPVALTRPGTSDSVFLASMMAAVLYGTTIIMSQGEETAGLVWRKVAGWMLVKVWLSGLALLACGTLVLPLTSAAQAVNDVAAMMRTLSKALDRCTELLTVPEGVHRSLSQKNTQTSPMASPSKSPHSKRSVTVLHSEVLDEQDHFKVMLEVTKPAAPQPLPRFILRPSAPGAHLLPAGSALALRRTRDNTTVQLALASLEPPVLHKQEAAAVWLLRRLVPSKPSPSANKQRAGGHTQPSSTEAVPHEHTHHHHHHRRHHIHSAQRQHHHHDQARHHHDQTHHYHDQAHHHHHHHHHHQAHHHHGQAHHHHSHLRHRHRRWRTFDSKDWKALLAGLVPVLDSLAALEAVSRDLDAKPLFTNLDGLAAEGSAGKAWHMWLLPHGAVPSSLSQVAQAPNALHQAVRSALRDATCHTKVLALTLSHWPLVPSDHPEDTSGTQPQRDLDWHIQSLHTAMLNSTEQYWVSTVTAALHAEDQPVQILRSKQHQARFFVALSTLQLVQHLQHLAHLVHRACGVKQPAPSTDAASRGGPVAESQEETAQETPRNHPGNSRTESMTPASEDSVPDAHVTSADSGVPAAPATVSAQPEATIVTVPADATHAPPAGHSDSEDSGSVSSMTESVSTSTSASSDMSVLPNLAQTDALAQKAAAVFSADSLDVLGDSSQQLGVEGQFGGALSRELAVRSSLDIEKGQTASGAATAADAAGDSPAGGGGMGGMAQAAAASARQLPPPNAVQMTAGPAGRPWSEELVRLFLCVDMWWQLRLALSEVVAVLLATKRKADVQAQPGDNHSKAWRCSCGALGRFWSRLCQLAGERWIQVAFKYWVVIVALLELVLCVRALRPISFFTTLPWVMYLTAMYVMRPQVEGTLSQAVLRILGTALGVLLGWSIMYSERPASNAVVVSGLVTIIVTVASVLTFTQLRLVVYVIQASVISVMLCQYRGCDHLGFCTAGSSNYALERMGNIMIGCLFPLLVNHLIAPWYLSSWALGRAADSFLSGASLLSHLYEDLMAHITGPDHPSRTVRDDPHQPPATTCQQTNPLRKQPAVGSGPTLQAVQGPLAEAVAAVAREGTAWQRGFLATPHGVHSMLAATTLLGDRLASMQVALQGAVQLSDSFSSWISEEVAGSLDKQLRDTLTQTQQLSQVTAQLLRSYRAPAHQKRRLLHRVGEQVDLAVASRFRALQQHALLRQALHEKVLTMALERVTALSRVTDKAGQQGASETASNHQSAAADRASGASTTQQQQQLATAAAAAAAAASMFTDSAASLAHDGSEAEWLSGTASGPHLQSLLHHAQTSGSGVEHTLLQTLSQHPAATKRTSLDGSWVHPRGQPHAARWSLDAQVGSHRQGVVLHSGRGPQESTGQRRPAGALSGGRVGCAQQPDGVEGFAAGSGCDGCEPARDVQSDTAGAVGCGVQPQREGKPAAGSSTAAPGRSQGPDRGQGVGFMPVPDQACEAGVPDQAMDGVVLPSGLRSVVPTWHPSDTVAWLACLYALSHAHDAAVHVARTAMDVVAETL